jgi:tRNA C32,U32 (ribose-2'-O)-methylase TrmJ
MAKRWVALILVVSLTTTLLNLVILMGQLSTPVAARAATGASKLLDDEDFQDGLTKIIRKTVRTYCTVSKREGIDC